MTASTPDLNHPNSVNQAYWRCPLCLHDYSVFANCRTLSNNTIICVRCFEATPKSDPKTIPQDPASTMTKREHMATEVIKGMMLSGEPEDVKHNAIVALRNADALIEELNRTSKP